MRDVLVSLILIGMLPMCFRKPFVGLLLFSVLAYMRVQDLTWGFAREQRWSFYIAIVMFAGFFANSRDRTFMLADVRNVIMVVLMLLVAVSLLAAGGGISAMDVTMFSDYVKIITIALFTTGVVHNRDRLRLMIWVIALSFGFFGFKSGIVGILTAGTLHIREGPGGMLQDNNDFALALGMGIPMMWHIASSERSPPIRRFFLLLLPLTLITVLMTHSRGGFLALAAGVSVLVWRSRNRVAGIVVASFLVLAGLLVAPAALQERLSTIREYEQDASVGARFRAWRTAAAMIEANPVLGVGYARFQKNYLDYSPDYREDPESVGRAHVAHNSYLQIWAECGTPAFLLYLSLIALSLLDLARVRRQAQRRYHASWILNYANMFEATLVVFVVGSMFLNRAQFDLFYHLVALVLAFGHIARREMNDRRAYPERTEGRVALKAVRPRGFARPAVLGGSF